MKLRWVMMMVIMMAAHAADASPLMSGPASLDVAKTLVENQNMATMQQGTDRTQLLKHANELESVFISKAIEPMFPEGENSFFGKSAGSDIYRYMMIQEYGKIFQAKAGLGIAQNIVKSLDRQRPHNQGVR